MDTLETPFFDPSLQRIDIRYQLFEVARDDLGLSCGDPSAVCNGRKRTAPIGVGWLHGAELLT